MGGGAVVPPPATTANNHLSPPPIGSPFSSNFNQINFGHVPSQLEIQKSISDLQRVMDIATNSEMNGGLEECLYDFSRSNIMKSLGQKRLLDAYHLLQTDASVQRLVISISSDPKVWDAILKNDAVQEVRGSLPHTATESGEKGMSYNQEHDSIPFIAKWIFAFMKSKIIEIIEKLEVFVLETLQHVSKNKNARLELDGLVEEKVRSSLLLSVVILMIVVVTRSIES